MRLPAYRLAPFSAKTRDRARLLFLLLVAFEVFVLPSFLAAGLLTKFHMAIVAGLTLAAGVVTVSAGIAVAVIAGLLSVTAFACRIWAALDPTEANQVLDALVTMLVVGLFEGMILAYVFGKERSTLHRMVGAVVVYLLIAIIFARAYHIIWLVHPQSLNLGDSEGSISDLSYFSFATLTTLGYGTPVGPFARSLVSLEALVGQLYPAILIARLVSLPSSQHPPER